METSPVELLSEKIIKELLFEEMCLLQADQSCMAIRDAIRDAFEPHMVKLERAIKRPPNVIMQIEIEAELEEVVDKVTKVTYTKPNIKFIIGYADINDFETKYPVTLNKKEFAFLAKTLREFQSEINIKVEAELDG